MRAPAALAPMAAPPIADSRVRRFTGTSHSSRNVNGNNLAIATGRLISLRLLNNCVHIAGLSRIRGRASGPPTTGVIWQDRAHDGAARTGGRGAAAGRSGRRAD